MTGRIDIIDHSSLPATKIALFRSLFCDRDDVYPYRFESRKTGKSGYQPVCGNKWVNRVCRKPVLLPTSHLFIERLIGSIRREYLDQTLFWNATDLERKLSDFQSYYNSSSHYPFVLCA